MRECAECGEIIVQGDPAIRAMGHLFCSDECSDDFEQNGPRDDHYDELDTFEGIDCYGSMW